MAITRSEFEGMDESELREKVLIPLFRAMGFRDVFHYHGGSPEQGKDIVMWKPDEIRDRTNYAVVAKADRISGKATGKGSAAEVTFQIQQCLGASYQDPTTIEERNVHICYVVSSMEIKKEAATSISSALAGTNCEGRVEFINGDRLWGLVEKYLADQLVIDKLQQARDVFEQASTHHRIVASIGQAGVTLSTQPKYEGAEQVDPVELKVKFVYPNTPEGIAAREELERHIATGSPVSISRQFLQELEFPDFLQPFLKKDEFAELSLGPRRGIAPIAVGLSITPIGGDPLRFDGLEFRMVQGGQDEITLSNTHQPTQPQFVIRVNTKDREISFTYLAEVENRNVKRQVDSARLQLALACGCSFALISSESGLSIVGGNLPPNPNVAVHNELLEFLEQVLLIQNRTRTPITVPARDIELEEARGIYEMAERLRKGKITGTINSLAFTVNRDGAKNLLTSAYKPDEVLTVTEEQIWNVLGTEVRVGRAVTIVRGMRLAQKALQNIQEGLANDTGAESFEVQYEPAGKDTEVILLYPDCGTDAESVAMREQLDAASIVSG